MNDELIILGASARAAAFSALRAGFRPWCADLFADTDLAARSPVVRLPMSDYPGGFARVLEQAPQAPWIYTGAMENRPELIAALGEIRPMWGNNAGVLGRARDPEFVAGLLRSAGLPAAAVCRPPTRPGRGRWLVKPLAGAGGVNIRFASAKGVASGKPVYFQEFIDGEPCSAVYAASSESVDLLGTSRQFIGVDWLHARPFKYCGSISFTPEAGLSVELEAIGSSIARGCGLRGLFGIDFMLRDGRAWLVEVNPRYTASVEVIEHAAGITALSWHRQAFAGDVRPIPKPGSARGVVGKAILFTGATLVFPNAGPWHEAVRSVHELPDYADVPRPGDVIPQGRPICTFLAQAESEAQCREALRRVAADLDHRFFRGATHR